MDLSQKTLGGQDRRFAQDQEYDPRAVGSPVGNLRSCREQMGDRSFP